MDITDKITYDREKKCACCSALNYKNAFFCSTCGQKIDDVSLQDDDKENNNKENNNKENNNKENNNKENNNKENNNKENNNKEDNNKEDNIYVTSYSDININTNDVSNNTELKSKLKEEFVFCTECGLKNEFNNKFCVHCGYDLKKIKDNFNNTTDNLKIKKKKFISKIKNKEEAFKALERNVIIEDETMSIFAEGMPDWDLIPPQTITRKGIKK